MFDINGSNELARGGGGSGDKRNHHTLLAVIATKENAGPVATQPQCPEDRRLDMIKRRVHKGCECVRILHGI